jgi:hypothetical protein
MFRTISNFCLSEREVYSLWVVFLLDPKNQRFSKKRRVPLTVAWGNNESAPLSDTIIRRSGVKFTIQPLDNDTIVAILSFIFEFDLRGNSHRLPEIARRYFTMLMNFIGGRDLTNDEKFSLPLCGTPNVPNWNIPRLLSSTPMQSGGLLELDDDHTTFASAAAATVASPIM